MRFDWWWRVRLALFVVSSTAAQGAMTILLASCQMRNAEQK